LDRAQRILDTSFDAIGELESGEGSRVEDAQTALDEMELELPRFR
jgi:hypothetical protein